MAHALLRRALSARGDRPPHEWTFTSNARGRPALASPVDSGLVFNLSHTDGLVACVTARELTIGIDVEAIDRETDALAVARTLFSPTEVAALERCAAAMRQVRFTEIWTLREAYVKAIGEGLSYRPSEFAFVFDDHASLRFEANTDVPGSPWRFALLAPSERHQWRTPWAGHQPWSDASSFALTFRTPTHRIPRDVVRTLRSTRYGRPDAPVKKRTFHRRTRETLQRIAGLVSSL